MNKIVLDFETRSKLDLKKVGPWKYAKHPSTDIVCMAEKVAAGVPADCHSRADLSQQCNRSLILNRIASYGIIEAHNAEFERAIWTHIMVPRYGFQPIPFEKWRCTAANAARHALPRKLEEVCKVLGLKHQKDMEGHRTMLKMSRPRKPTKNNPATWNEDPEDLKQTMAYCVDDVEAEWELSDALDPMPERELAIWRLDQIINERGVHIDLDGIRAIKALMQRNVHDLNDELFKLTNGAISTSGQVAEILKFLEAENCSMLSLDKESVARRLDALVKSDENPKARRILEIRQTLSKASTAKLTAMEDRACLDDSRCRSTVMYHGASTGRWAGKAIQPQNLIRNSYSEEEVNQLIALCKRDPASVELLFDQPMLAASKAVRGVICAAPGNHLFCGDFNAIEGRGLAWLAGEQHVLAGYIAGRDPYKVAASSIYGVDYKDVTKAQRQIGKVCELALGYQGWVGAFATMAKNYGTVIEEEEAEKIIKAWRDNRPMTRRFWKGLEQAALAAVQNPGTAYSYRAITFGVRKKFLMCRLPSGRFLYYFDPGTREEESPWGAKRTIVTYMGVDSYTRKWVRQGTYGGKLAENVTQAVCRDLIAESMIRTENAGYPITMTVHDEQVSEVPLSFGKLEHYKALMEIVPPWANGMPIKAECWSGKRYRK